MKTIECTREQDILDALTSGRWPDRVNAELLEHTGSCAICADVIAVAQPILADREDLTAEPRIPSSAVMWWRAQLRARQEAAREAERPITVAHAIGTLFAIASIGGLAFYVSPSLRGVIANIGTSMASPAALDLQATLVNHGWLLTGIVATILLLLTPVVIYLATTEE